MKPLLKKLVGPRWQARARRLSRLRWMTKYGILRRRNERVRERLGYLLWDPEVESHTFEVLNRDELAEFIAERLGADVTQVRAYLDEPDSDPAFNEQWRSRMRLRFDVKHNFELGNRLLWWGLVRTLRPRLVVECGTYNGIGALIVLRALERNGDDGRLLSIDYDPEAGWAVPANLRSRWTLAQGMTTELLPGLIEHERVDMIIHDTDHTYENVAHEFGAALAHGADRVLLVDSSGRRTEALPDLCAARGASSRLFVEETGHGPWPPRSGTDVALLPSDA